MDQTGDDTVLRARALSGLRRYQEAQRPPRPPEAPVIASHAGARLLRYGSDWANNRAPVLFVPSLINPPHVLDISERASMLRWMAAQGHDAMLVDWGHPGERDRDVDLGGHVMDRLLPLIAGIQSPRPPVLVGYCLGGTLALSAAQHVALSALAVIAAPWHFSAMPDQSRADVARLWAGAKPTCERLGYVPMEVLQSGFWMLDPARTIAKYADFADMADGSDAMAAFLALEDWANAGPPLTYAAGRELFETLYSADATGQGRWTVDGAVTDPSAHAMPTLSVASSTDHIVPASCAPKLAEQWTLDMGHVGMIVGSRAQEKLWRPLSQWLFNHGG